MSSREVIRGRKYQEAICDASQDASIYIGVPNGRQLVIAA